MMDKLPEVGTKLAIAPSGTRYVGDFVGVHPHLGSWVVVKEDSWDEYQGYHPSQLIALKV